LLRSLYRSISLLLAVALAPGFAVDFTEGTRSDGAARSAIRVTEQILVAVRPVE
jgi:hypothetical protein